MIKHAHTLHRLSTQVVYILGLLSVFYLFGVNVIDPHKQLLRSGQLEPVVTDFSVIDEIQTERGVKFDIRMFKPENRTHCEYVNTLAVKNEEVLKLIVKKPEDEDFTRNWGWSYAKGWEILNIANLSGVVLVAQHHCTDASTILTTTPLYPVSATTSREDFVKYNKL